MKNTKIKIFGIPVFIQEGVKVGGWNKGENPIYADHYYIPIPGSYNGHDEKRLKNEIQEIFGSKPVYHNGDLDVPGIDSKNGAYFVSTDKGVMRELS